MRAMRPSDPTELPLGGARPRESKPGRKVRTNKTPPAMHFEVPDHGSGEALQQFRALIEAREMAQRTLAQDLADERRRRQRAESSEAQLKQALMFKDTVIDAIDDRQEVLPGASGIAARTRRRLRAQHS